MKCLIHLIRYFIQFLIFINKHILYKSKLQLSEILYVYQRLFYLFEKIISSAKYWARERKEGCGKRYCRIDWLIFLQMKAQAKLHNLICEASSVRIIARELIQCRHYSWSNDAVVHQRNFLSAYINVRLLFTFN